MNWKTSSYPATYGSPKVSLGCRTVWVQDEARPWLGTLVFDHRDWSELLRRLGRS